MACDGLIDINKTIFAEYFENDNGLSNLYKWLVTDNNKYCILNTDTDILCNFQVTTFLNGDPGDSLYNCNINNSIKSFSNIVKNVNDSYDIIEFSDANSKHFIPNIPNSLIDKIDNEHKNKIVSAFNIYQFYDHLINTPEDLAKSSFNLNLYNFINITNYAITPDNTICPISRLSHYTNIITNNQRKDKLTPSVIYMCRGIYLTLLYKYIAQIYLSYYTICDSLTTNKCPDSALININVLMNNFKKSINKLILFSSYSLYVTYNSNKLTIDNISSPARSFFDPLNKDNHIIYNITQNKYIEIIDNISIVSNFYTITGTLESKFNANDKCVILAKKSDYVAYSYNNTINGLNNTNKQFNTNKSDYQKSVTNYDIVNNSFNNIDYIYYLTFLIIIIVIVSIIATNSEQSRKTRVFIILIIVVLIYIMIFSYLAVTKELAESFSTIINKSREIGIINGTLLQILTSIYTESSTFGMIKLYDTLNIAATNELNNISKQSKSLTSNTNRNEATTNSEWHRLFQRTLFIHTVFLFLIVILTYLWLSTTMPGINIYLLFITIIACMVLIFYYFRNLHRVVRSEYKHRYWTKMDVSK
jgi:hypothetical protein